VVSLKLQKPSFANDYLDLLGEYDAICETALACESGPLKGLFDKKKGQKSLDSVPLSQVFRIIYVTGTVIKC
jgi:hypothetical protein